MSAAAAPQSASGQRIVAVVGDYPVVSKTFVTDQLVALVRAGHALTVLAQPPGARSMPSAQVPDAVRAALVQRPAAPPGKPARALHVAGHAMQSVLRAPRVTVALLTEPGLRTARRRQLLHALASVLHVGEPDVFHCHFGDLGGDVAEVRDRLGWRAAVVTSFHGFDLSRHVSRSNPDVFAHLFSSGDLFLPVSEHWRRRLLELGAPADKVLVQRMGIDLSRFEVVERRAERHGGLRVLSVCRLVEKKGLRHGLDAVALLRDRGMPVRYTVVGDGPERGSLQQRAAELGLKDVVAFAGVRSREEVLAALRDSDVLLCPSVTAADGDTEGIPMILMEAMATALPVVSSWHSGIPELVEDGRSGLLAPEGDADALADHLERLHLDPALGARLGRCGRQRVEQDFDVARLVEQLADRLATAAAVRRAAAAR